MKHQKLKLHLLLDSTFFMEMIIALINIVHYIIEFRPFVLI